MSSIQLSGLSTGIDTQSLIAQLMAVERRTINMYEARKAKHQEEKNVLSELQGLLSTLQSKSKALYDDEKLRAYGVASSDEDIVTAEASHDAFEGNHSVVINQLAAAERWVHSTGLEYAEDYVGEGTFIFSYNHKEIVIETTDTTTLNDLVGLINNDAENPGVTAGLLFYNDMHHLVLSGNDAGTDYEIKINSSNTEVWEMDWEFEVDSDNATLQSRITELDQFSGTLGTGDTININGTNASGVAITQVQLTVTDNTRIEHLIGEINDAFDGIATARFENGKITLVSDASGSSDMSINLTFTQGSGSTAALTLPDAAADWDETDGGVTTADLANFAEADFTETQQAQDSQIKVDGYPGGANDWITRSSNTVDDVIAGVTLHLHDVTDANGEQITLTRDVESVKTNLDAFISAYNDVVTNIKENTKYSENADEAGILIGDYLVRLIREQLRTPLYSQTDGFVEDIDSFLNPAQIGLDLDSDGFLSLDSATFNEAIADDYLGVLALIGADKTGSSNSNDIKFYGAGNNTTAGSYMVKAVYDGSGNLSEAFIKKSDENDSQYRSTTIVDNVIIGNTSLDSDGDPVYPEYNLQVTAPLTGTAGSTSYATIRVKQGFTGNIEDSLSNILHITEGSLTISQDSLDDKMETLQDKIELEEYRLGKREDRLIQRFAALEQTLSLMQGQLQYILAFGSRS